MVTLTSAQHDTDGPLEAIEYAYRMGWTDGLPIVPPTAALVQATIAAAGRAPDTVLARMTPRNRVCTVEKAAINAVMAGCEPRYFPVVCAVLDAVSEEAYNFFASTASTGGSAQFIVVNGPIRRELGINGGPNCYGPGFRANATIGRAMRLILLNVFGMQPGVTDRATQGHPGKYSFCIAEDEEASPWEPWHVERGFPAGASTVTVFAAEGPHVVQNHLSGTGEGILYCIADTMANLGSFSSGQTAVVVAPEHAQILAGDGWTKPAMRDYLYQHARRTVADIKRGGKLTVLADGRGGADSEVSAEVLPGDEQRWVHRGRGPDDILLVVAGGDAGGFSSVITSWSRGRGSLFQTKPIIRPA